jgi:hypothetical protein
MGFPKGASIPFGQGRGQNPAREVALFIDARRTGAIYWVEFADTIHQHGGFDLWQARGYATSRLRHEI